MGLLFLYLGIAVFVSFICSVLEAVLLSVTPTFVASKVREGKPYARLLEKYKKEIDLPLAAILTLNTFAHTIGAAGVGGQVQLIWGNEFVSISSAILTIVILIFSEIIPKTIGANYWKQLALYSAPVLSMMIYSPLFPLIWLSKLITKILSNNEQSSVLSRSEFQAMTELGIEEGIFQESESKILTNLMRFNSIQAKSIMTPRTVIVAAEEDTSVETFYRSSERIRFSRIPVYKDELDNVTGYVLKDDLMEEIIEDRFHVPLRDIRREITVVADTMPIVKLFYRLIEKREHIAMVVGEYGEFLGIVTMEDVIETLLGMEIVDELDNVEDMQIQAKRNWERRARRLGLIP
jgi:CBS domain containing-hemolysin-like protein